MCNRTPRPFTLADRVIYIFNLLSLMDQRMEPPTKILIVGEKGTGKSSIVSIFKEYESGGSSCTKSTEGGQGSSGFRNENAN